MKKENFIIGLIAVGVIAFLLGRVSVSTKDKPKADAPVATATPGQAATAAPTPPAPAPVAPTAAVEAPKAEAAAPAPVPAAPTREAVAAPSRAGAVGGASANVIDSPRKGPADAKVTIVEISEFQ